MIKLTQSSLQLRLDKLGISDSKFGSFSVDETGLITITEGGVEYAVGQVSIARFTNNQGLLAVGDNNFQATQESGKAIYSINNNNTSGMQGQTLELSEADLSESLVNLMVFQRAFEANAKSITTADEMLTTLINLKDNFINKARKFLLYFMYRKKFGFLISSILGILLLYFISSANVYRSMYKKMNEEKVL